MELVATTPSERDFAVTAYEHDGVLVLCVTGDLDMVSAPMLRGALLDPNLDPTCPLIVDLRTVTFIDSTGLSALVAGSRRFADAGGQMRVVVTSPHVLGVLRVTGLTEVLDLFPDVASADLPVAVG
jgi:anti-sigma B factor antagonist